MLTGDKKPNIYNFCTIFNIARFCILKIMVNSLKVRVVACEIWDISQLLTIIFEILFRITLSSFVIIWEGCFSWLLRSNNGVFANLDLLLINLISADSVFCCFKTKFLRTYFCFFHGKIDLVLVMSNSFSKSSCQVMSNYNPYI